MVRKGWTHVEVPKGWVQSSGARVRSRFSGLGRRGITSSRPSPEEVAEQARKRVGQ